MDPKIDVCVFQNQYFYVWALALCVLGSRLKSMFVKATSKIVFAFLLAMALFVNPIGACGGTIQAKSTPSHPCCPKDKAPDTCAKPGCVCTNAEPAAIVAPENVDVIPLPALVTNNTVIREVIVFSLIPVQRVPSTDHPRFLTFHQILV